MVAPPKPQRIALGPAVERFLDAMDARVTVGELSDRTVLNYRQDLGHLTRILGTDTVADDITGADLDRALLEFGRRPDARRKKPTGAGGQSAATQKRYHQSVSRFFSYAEKHQWVQMSPVRWADLKPRVRSELRTARTALSGEQALSLLLHGYKPLLEAKRSHEQNETRDHFLIALLVVTGPRVSEVANANDADFSVRDGILQWRIFGKGGKSRIIPLSEQLQELRANYLAERPAPSPNLPPEARVDGARAAFRTGRGNRISPRDIERLMDKAYLRVVERDPQNAREFTPHALRHTAATLMLAKGWDVKVVAEMLGHASIATTGMYLDSIPGELARAVADSSVLTALANYPNSNDREAATNVA